MVTQDPAAKKKIVKKTKKEMVDTMNPENVIFVMDSKNVVALSLDAKSDIATPIGALSYEDVFNEIKNSIPLETPILEENTLFYKRLNKGSSTYHYIFYQFNPQMRTIHYKHDKVVSKNYELSMPYIIFFTLIKEVQGQLVAVSEAARVFVSKKRISSTKDTLLLLPLGNLYGDGKICWGYNSIAWRPEEGPTTFGRRVAGMFFGSVFNDDLGIPFMPAELGSIQNWEVKSKDDPHFGITIPYRDSKWSIETLVKWMAENY